MTLFLLSKAAGKDSQVAKTLKALMVKWAPVLKALRS